ncbi:hypothetical protein QJS04_geneDACA019347 [Acorus gramineus]|uniref:Uncharacterized protein n=1 Tax=Acorus gramineus TaxID=55184 RepID=A0AAV9AQ24_ACOGR|nr:hypothetical protein QJS04_geneDACA019347 [Acorus gramineus]
MMSAAQVLYGDIVVRHQNHQHNTSASPAEATAAASLSGFHRRHLGPSSSSFGIHCLALHSRHNVLVGPSRNRSVFIVDHSGKRLIKMKHHNVR